MSGDGASTAAALASATIPSSKLGPAHARLSEPERELFVSPASAERWLADQRDVRGSVISMPEAAAGRAVFGDVLTQS